jgi:hypothetical protein
MGPGVEALLGFGEGIRMTARRAEGLVQEGE